MKSMRSVTTRRALGILVFLLVLFFIIITRFFQVMIFRSEESVRQDDTIYADRDFGQRGKIVDKDGNILATSVQTASLYANPRQVSDPRSVARQLARHLDLSAAEIFRRLERDRYFIWIQRHLEDHVIDSVRGLGIDGIEFMEEPRRTYPHGKRASSLLGVVGIDNQGKEGLELQYNDFLSGDSSDQATVPELRLTVDLPIQRIVEEELGRFAERESPRWATVVLMRPGTGEIVAMADWPTFNPNKFQQYSSYHFRNKAVSFDFEPGSTLKMMTVGSGLAEGVFESQTEFTCRGRYQIEGTDHMLRCYAAHGELSVPEILIKSCNVGTVKAVSQMSPETFYKNMRAFGFGNWTGIRLPGESRGILRLPARWSNLTQPSIAIGQGISVTSLQLTRALAGIVNDGVLMKPRVVAEKNHQNGEHDQFQPVSVRRVMPVEAARKLQQYMEEVVTRGTGRRAASDKFRLAGKTGTAQKVDIEDGGYHEDKVLASFIGFGPVESPKLVASVIVDEPSVGRYGGEVAAPVFRRIMERSLEHLDRNP